MSDTGKVADDLPCFHLTERYRNVDLLFQTFVPPLDSFKESAIFVLDTSVLLLPFNIEKSSLEAIRAPYEKLVKEDRLFIPGYVAREFAKQRENKLSDVFNAIASKRNISFNRADYRFLLGVPEFEALRESEKVFATALEEYRRVLNTLLDRIRSWRWNDPVSQLYAELFQPNVLVECSLSNEDIEKDMNRRWKNRIAPGYKDGSKDDRGIGDVVIWNTVLELGMKFKKPLVLVSGDEKTDWFLQSNKENLFARFEIVREYQSASNGMAIEIIRLSDLLRLFEVRDEVVSEVKGEERREEAKIKKADDSRIVGAELYFEGEDSEIRATAALNFLKPYYSPFLYSCEMIKDEDGHLIQLEFNEPIAAASISNLVKKLDAQGVLVENYWMTADL